MSSIHKKRILDKRMRRERTQRRIRNRQRGSADRPRLAVYKSLRYIYAQIIDSANGHVISSASTVEGELRKSLKYGGNMEAAKAVGKRIAEKAKAAGVEYVAFDRSGFKYHGRISALADAARESGLKF